MAINELKKLFIQSPLCLSMKFLRRFNFVFVFDLPEFYERKTLFLIISVDVYFCFSTTFTKHIKLSLGVISFV